MRYLVYHKHGIIRRTLHIVYIYSRHIRYPFGIYHFYCFINQ